MSKLNFNFTVVVRFSIHRIGPNKNSKTIYFHFLNEYCFTTENRITFCLKISLKTIDSKKSINYMLNLNKDSIHK
jgi:hypothetical protein